MNYNREMLEELRKNNLLLEIIARDMKTWKDADVEAHYKRHKEINHKLSVVLDMMVKFMRTFQSPQGSPNDESTRKIEPLG